MARKGLLSVIKSDVEKTGSNRGKFFYVKTGAKARIRFIDDIDDGRIVHFHDRWDPQLKAPCKKNYDEDADCPYCDVEGIRSRDMYAWSIWDYEANEVKIFMYPANQCSPVPSLAAMCDTYGTIIDRDFTVTRSGTGTNTTYSVIPLDKSQFRNSKAKPFSDKAFWKALSDAYPDSNSELDEEDDEDEDGEDETPVTKSKGSQKSKQTATKSKSKEENPPWEDDEDEDLGYSEMSARELFDECKKRKIEVKPRMQTEYYIKKLKKWDSEKSAEEDDEDDFWGDDDEE